MTSLPSVTIQRLREELERGRTRVAEVKQALQAALEDLAKAKQQAYESRIQVARAGAALNRVLLHVTGCSEGEFDTCEETAERILEQLRDNAQHLKETSDAFLQTTGELLAAQGDLAKVTKEQDELAAKLTECGEWLARVRSERDELQAIYEDIGLHYGQVAAKVLRSIAPQINEYDGKALLYEAVLYERGEKEVPGE